MWLSSMNMSSKRRVCEATYLAWGLSSRTAPDPGQFLTISAVLQGCLRLLVAGTLLYPALEHGASPGLLQPPRHAVVAVVGGEAEQWVPDLEAAGLGLWGAELTGPGNHTS